jgi:hypothetical protein
MNIPVTTNRENFFKEFMYLMKPFYETYLSKDKDEPVKISAPGELRIIAYMMYYNDAFKDMEEEQRWIILNDYETNMKIRSKVGMKTAVYHNAIHSLKEKGVFEIKEHEGKKLKILKEFFRIYPDKEVAVNFLFKLNENKPSHR